MKWEKCGKIVDAKTLDIPWFKLNVMTPMPYMHGEILRLFVGLCDEDNRSRIGYIDLNPENPSKIIGYSKLPVLDLGERGRFDEDGVLPGSLLQEDGKLFFYYSGYQRQRTVPYAILSGLAVSEDDGDSFKRVYSVPILERTDDEMFLRAPMEVIKVDGNYLAWYGGGSEWFNRGDKSAPKYRLKFLKSDKKDVFGGNSVLAMRMTDDEYGLAMPQIWRASDGIFKMIYSIRSLSKGYRMGYAESKDGIFFDRMDDQMEIDVSKDGWDSEMICFGRMIRCGQSTFLFYCGNHYGQGGLGYAVLRE